MLEQKERVGKFLDAIAKEAQAEREAIASEIERLSREEMEKAEAEAEARAEAVRSDTLRRNRLRCNRKIAGERDCLRRVLTEKREQLEKALFHHAREQLQAFAQSAEYETFLLKSLAACGALPAAADAVFYIREADMRYREAIQKTLGFACDVRADASIQIGGWKAEVPSRKLALDDSLDARLAQQREQFRQSAKLNIMF